MNMDEFLEREYSNLNNKDNIIDNVYDFRIQNMDLKDRIRRLEKISYVFNLLKDAIKNNEIDENTALSLLETNKFIELCQYAGEKFEEIHDEFEFQECGKWVIYNKNAIGLVADLKGKNTGWPFAEKIRNIKPEYCYHIFYTKNENGEYSVPRLGMVILNHNNIKIYGVAKNNYIESGMECVIERRLKQFLEIYQFVEQLDILKKITLIYSKYKEGKFLKNEDLKFIYSANEIIRGFRNFDNKSLIIGKNNIDLRISEIISNRNVNQDLNRIYGNNLNTSSKSFYKKI